jgi:hypothetical protein
MSPIIPLAILGAIGAYFLTKPKPAAPAPQGGGVVPAGTGQSWRNLSIDEFQKLEGATGQSLIEGAPPPHGLKSDDRIILIATTTNPESWSPLYATVTSPDPNADRGFAEATVSYGPASGMVFKLNTKDESDAYLWNEVGVIDWLTSKGFAPPGVSV